MDELMRGPISWLAFAAETGAKEGEKAEHHLVSFEGTFIYLAFVLVIIFAVTGIAKKGFNNQVFSTPLALAAEHLYYFIENFAVGIIGPHGRKYIPIMIGFWLIIFFSNLVALFFPTSTTTDIGFNLGMALVAVGYVQYEGIRSNGFFGHLSHFAGPKLTGPLVIVSGMIFIIEIISETMKNVSLSLRLFGNIEGGHLVTNALNDEIGKFLMFPVGALLLPVKLMTCLIQAMIFVLLTCVYLSLVTHHHDEHEEHEGEHHPAEATAH